ncbi:multidrug ABC transporter ATP-binding protein [Anaerobacillus alkalilacustris]|uniref:Multidrug ABC transporter ATP-binding protein n=1 Tax=Anaerobacillus alkalilacustris TaxID=393763 RepID=A0A1S2LSG8_9BACI|nr:ABC transporter ATP-binding protein [Anaerobacillus alkalilacustris]OIJ14325.1 multidrug ABC transporter ATP-binding protein [Anaerobacillus alkalilacustris]
MLVTIKDLTKNYKEHTAVKQITFSIEKGRCIALLGPNGAGKTTTLQMLAGLLAPTSGKIEFEGCQQKDYRTLIGFLPQHPSFFNWMTPKGFLQFVGDLSHVPKKQLTKRIEEILEFVSLTEVKNKKIGGFSGGMKQRLGLAQALLHEPELLILDEPVSALDPTGRRDVLHLIDQLKNQMTIIFSTHILHDAEQVCEEILMLKDGSLIWNGTLDSLKKEFDSLAIKLQTDGAIKGVLDKLDFIENIEYLDLTTVRFTMNDVTKTNVLLQYLISQNLTIVHYETVKDSLEDAYMKVMER